MSASTRSPPRRAVPADDDGRLAVALRAGFGRGERGVEARTALVHQARAPDYDGVAVDRAVHAHAVDTREIGGRGERAELRRGGPGDGLRDRMFGGGLQGTGVAQQRGAVGSRPDDHVDQGHSAGGDGAGLVEHDRVDPAGGLQHFGPLDEDAELGRAAGADQ
ncbi:hypothetical protein MINTMi198_52030 [Mycobacterium intracellulare M.i.198]|nr:hypothetical protein MINTMi198_52030 [Mycobacterium intracellulare M.i.198]